MIKHIFFPCDLSESTQIAFANMLELALPFHAKVTLFHAYELMSLPVIGQYNSSLKASIQEIERTMEQTARDYLKGFSGQLDTAGIENEYLVLRGPAGPLIVEMANKRICDLIIMASRGLRPVNAFLMGSTSTYVLHHSLCPVLVIPCRPVSGPPAH